MMEISLSAGVADTHAGPLLAAIQSDAMRDGGPGIGASWIKSNESTWSRPKVCRLPACLLVMRY